MDSQLQHEPQSSVVSVSGEAPAPAPASAPAPAPAPDSSTANKATTTTVRHPKRTIVRRRRPNKQEQEQGDSIPTIDPNLMKESNLPLAYSFEIPKTVQRIHSLKATHVALQMPEGLLLYASVLADLLKKLCSKVPLKVVTILGDVTYGACCIDDLGARALGAQLLIHYGHSCLVPLQHTVIPCLYVFVEIQFDVSHMCDCLVATLQASSASSKSSSKSSSNNNNNNNNSNNNNNNNNNSKSFFIYLLGTIQFRHALVEAKELLQAHGYDQVHIPQVKPLSPGEVLGCTSPRLDAHLNITNTKELADKDDKKPVSAIVCFVADGRFHLESTLISNPPPLIETFYRYDPYSKALTIEEYDHPQMKQLRWKAICAARPPNNNNINNNNTSQVQTFGIILGTLGRQGNPAIVQRILQVLKKHGKRHFLLLLSEITPQKLQLLSPRKNSHHHDNDDGRRLGVVVVDAWVQVACPRLSVDWGHLLSDTQPVLTPYEFFCCMGEVSASYWAPEEDEQPQQQQQQQQAEENNNRDLYYPMDYYSHAGGPWSNYYAENKDRKLLVSKQQQQQGL